MKARRHVLMYAPEFARLVERGVKRCTIRRNRLWLASASGDVLEHREWEGVPYRKGSTHRLIKTTRCTCVRAIEIDRKGAIRVDGAWVTQAIARQLAKADGFESFAAFVAYFKQRRGSFRGLLIEWA